MRRAAAVTSLLLLLAALTAALAHDHGAGAAPAASPPTPAQKAFDRLKSLEGTWTGTVRTTGDASPTTVVYKVTAAGSAVMETLFPGTPHEMVTMYHVDGADLVLTHYCAGRNQPHMKATRITDGELAFEFVSGTNMKPSDPHMHALKMVFPGPGKLHAEWTSVTDGQPDHTAVFELARS